MELNILNILSMGASISTIVGLVIAIITLRYLYLEKKEKLEYETNKAFLNGNIWTNGGVFSSEEYDFFELHCDETPFYRLSGEIRRNGSEDMNDIFYFNFYRSNGKKMIFNITKVSSKHIISKATLKYLSSDMFIIVFSKHNILGLPKESYIWPIRNSTSEVC